MAWGVACRSDSILHDPRNRQLLVYVRLIEVLQPSFVLLEQVLDILLKENGVYVKAMTANLVRMGYQAHTGTLITGAYGCPQVRPRCCRCRLWPRFSGSCGWHTCVSTWHLSITGSVVGRLEGRAGRHLVVARTGQTTRLFQSLLLFLLQHCLLQ